MEQTASNPLLTQIRRDLTAAMKDKDRERVAVIRLIMSAVKQKEVDERIDVNETQLLTILDKMCKQRRDSIEQFRQGQRDDLADKEAFELEIIAQYMPKPLSPGEITQAINEAIAYTKADSIKAMGQVMAHLKAKVQGRADLKQVGEQVKRQLSEKS